ncbi:MAG: DUF4838 domain-containing protein [Armatimonadota bacterium]
MRIARLLTILGALLALATSAQAIPLVEDGQPVATIVLAAEPGEIEVQAAEQLRDYLQRMSGAELPIVQRADLPGGPVVLIGRHPAALAAVGNDLSAERLGYDGIILRSSADRLIVLGHRGQGQLYAVYDLLKRLGCRFYLPHPDGEIVPRRDTIAVEGLDVIHRPDFIHRVHWNNRNVAPTLAHPEWYRDWAVRNYQGGVQLMHGHNYFGFCPADRYFDEHPEYFPLIGGQGAAPKRTPMGQLCLSNPEVVDLAVRGAIAAFERSPDLGSYSLSPNDTHGWCECEACRAMDSPDPEVAWAWRVLTFNNQVAERVAERFPEKLFIYYGEYGNMPGPPLGMTAHPNVVTAIVNIYDIIHAIDDPDSAQNAEYRKRLAQWDEIVKGIFMYEWYTYSVLPSPQVYAVGDRIRYYRDLGIMGYSGEVLNRSPENDLSMYLASQMLWDADQDPEAMLDEFFDLYFRGAAERMREYYRLLHETSYFSDHHAVRAPTSAWTPELIGRLYRKLAEAFNAAGGNPQVERRLWREQKCLVAIDLIAAAYRYADGWARGDAQARERGMRAVQAACDWLDQIADEDIVADSYMKAQILPLRTGVFESDHPVAPNSARHQPGWDDESTFGDLWETNDLIADAPELWRFRPDPRNVGIEEEWFAVGLDDSGWDEIRIREFWDAQGYDVSGHAWYRVRWTIPQEAAGRTLMLYFGAVDEQAWVWVNAEPAGEHTGNPHALWDKRFALEVTDLIRPGRENVIAVRVANDSAVGGLWKSIKLVAPK